jgi:DNA-directed RNA polymerase specialized sigma24 family protein
MTYATPSMTSNTIPQKQQRQRKAVVPPRKVTKDMNVFEYLSRCNPALDRKIADIACSQTGVPPELREDAVQEIYLMWSNMKPDTKKYKPGQVASYAHQMARHAALRLRREIGSATCLPGSAFRKRKDGSSYVTPGVLAAPVDWNELEAWFQADGGEGMNPLAGASEADLMSVSSLFEATTEDPESTEEGQRLARLAEVEAVKAQLTDRQYRIAVRLVNGDSLEEIMKVVEVKKGVLMRELAMVATLVSGD